LEATVSLLLCAVVAGVSLPPTSAALTRSTAQATTRPQLTRPGLLIARRSAARLPGSQHHPEMRRCGRPALAAAPATMAAAATTIPASLWLLWQPTTP